MKRNSFSRKFWAGLTSFNVIALLYPYRSPVQAESKDARLIAATTYCGALLLLAIVDAIFVKLA